MVHRARYIPGQGAQCLGLSTTRSRLRGASNGLKTTAYRMYMKLRVSSVSIHFKKIEPTACTQIHLQPSKIDIYQIPIAKESTLIQ